MMMTYGAAHVGDGFELLIGRLLRFNPSVFGSSATNDGASEGVEGV